MPLDGEGEVSGVPDLYRLDGPVWCGPLDDQPIGQAIDALPMQRVHLDLRRPDDAGKATAGRQFDGMSRHVALVIRTLRRPMVEAFRLMVDMGQKRTAEGNVKLLKSAAYTENRQAGLEAGADQRQGDGVARRILRAVRAIGL